MFIFRCVYGILGREITKFMVIYGVYIRFWPTLNTLYADVQGNTRIHVLENIQRPRSVCTCTHYSHTHRVGQNRIYTPNMTVCMVIYVLKIPYIHCIYSYMYMLVLANSKHTHTTNCRHAVYHKCTYTHYSHTHTTNCRHAVYHKCTYTHYSHIHTHTHHKLQACSVSQVHIHTLLTHTHTHTHTPQIAGMQCTTSARTHTTHKLTHTHTHTHTQARARAVSGLASLPLPSIAAATPFSKP